MGAHCREGAAAMATGARCSQNDCKGGPLGLRLPSIRLFDLPLSLPLTRTSCGSQLAGSLLQRFDNLSLSSDVEDDIAISEFVAEAKEVRLNHATCK